MHAMQGVTPVAAPAALAGAVAPAAGAGPPAAAPAAATATPAAATPTPAADAAARPPPTCYPWHSPGWAT